MPRIFNKDMLPFRDLKLALGYATLWFIIFGIMSYPLDSWALAAAIFYIALWVSRVIVVAAVSFALKRLAAYGRRIVQKIGGELSEGEVVSERHSPSKLVFATTILVIFTVLGLSLSVGIPVVGMYGGASLPLYFSWIAWALLGVGVVGISLILTFLALLFSTVETLYDNFEVGVASVEAVSNGVAVLTGSAR